MKIAVVGAWHVHTMEYSTAILNNPKGRAVLPVGRQRGAG